ncbi:SprB repeat-containing protein, partial [Chitinophaga dinghuensis]|uniref:SprB repeat-containing protein n=1 Tax=Chitinophaga dinghuensis TaxID=1539050 RepID=UPI001B870FA3
DVNECSSSAQTAVVGEPPLAVSVSLQTRDVLCYNTPTGQIISLQGANGDGNYSYSTDNTSWTSNTLIDQLPAGTYTVYIKDGKGCSGFQNNVKINTPSQLQISQTGTVVPVSCNGLSDGSFSVAASGGSGNVRFFLSTAPTIANTTGVFNNLPAGSYTVKAQDDNGCEVHLPAVNIIQPNAMSLAISASPVLCYGQSNGSISVTNVGGGNGGYTFSKDDISYSGSQTFGSLTANDYTIYAKDTKGCKTSATTTVSQPTVLTFSTTSTPVLCNGGSSGGITIQANGGTTPYNYALDNGSFQSVANFPVSAGDHKIIVQDKNGCQQSSTVTITEPTVVSLTITDERKVTCNGGNNGGVTVAGAGGVGPYSYAINGGGYTTSNVFNGLTAGTYTITVKDANQCTASIPATVTAFSALNYSIISKTDILCAGDQTGALQLQGTGGAGGYSYQLDGGSFQTNPSWINLGKKNYPLVIKDANNCTASFTIPIVELYAPLAMALSSNPPATCADKGSITVTLAQGGKMPYQYSLDNSNYVNTNVFSNLNNGDYIVYVRDAAGCTINQGISPYGPVSIHGNIAATDATCFGKADGKVVISGVTGGTGAYEYSLNGGTWQSSPVFNNIAGGQTYNVVVRDVPYTCQIQLSAAVNQPTALQPQLLSTQNISCNGLSNGMIDMTVSGGTPGYTFAIGGNNQSTGTFTQLTAGNYNIIITDKQGCTSNLPVVLTEPQPLVAQVATVKDIDCYGNGNGSISLTAGGGTIPYAYTLNTTTQSTPQFNQLQAGTYQLKVTDAQGCNQQFTATIAEPSRLTLTVTPDMVKC